MQVSPNATLPNSEFPNPEVVPDNIQPGLYTVVPACVCSRALPRDRSASTLALSTLAFDFCPLHCSYSYRLQ
jgi:hypothetical protein